MKDLAIKLLTNHGNLIASAFVALLVGAAANLANALLKYPETETLGHTILDRLTFLARSDSPGTVKMLGKRSTNPNKIEDKK